jgi:hypothetical protein
MFRQKTDTNFATVLLLLVDKTQFSYNKNDFLKYYNKMLLKILIIMLFEMERGSQHSAL